MTRADDILTGLNTLALATPAALTSRLTQTANLSGLGVPAGSLAAAPISGDPVGPARDMAAANLLAAAASGPVTMAGALPIGASVASSATSQATDRASARRLLEVLDQLGGTDGAVAANADALVNLLAGKLTALLADGRAALTTLGGTLPDGSATAWRALTAAQVTAYDTFVARASSYNTLRRTQRLVIEAELGGDTVAADQHGRVAEYAIPARPEQQSAGTTDALSVFARVCAHSPDAWVPTRTQRITALRAAGLDIPAPSH